MSMFPRDVTKLLTGRHRILYGPASDVDIPTRISDVIDVISPYAPKTGWVDVGATSAAATYARAITKNGLNIQQTSETVKEEVQTVERTFGFTAAETSPLLVAVAEESPSTVTLTAGANKGAETGVDFGSITDLTRYRLAILTMFSRSDGEVIEPGGLVRGTWAGIVAYQTELNAETYTVSFGESEMVGNPITVKTFPDPTITADGKEHGRWLFESAGTIAAS